MICFCFFGSGNTAREKMLLIFVVKKHGVAHPGIIEKTCFFCGMEAGGRDGGEGEEGCAGLLMFAACQSNVFLRWDQTRSMEYRLETSVATRIGANTAVNKKKVSKRTVRIVDLIDVQQ